MSTLATDLFNGASLGANWTVDTGGAWTESGGVIKETGLLSADSQIRYSAITWPNDQWSETTVGTAGTSGGAGVGYGPIVRKASGATVTLYRFIVSAQGWELGKDVAGVFTSFSSGTATTWAVGDTAYLEVQGSTLTAKKNTVNGQGGTVIATQSDGTITTGWAGVMYSSNDVGIGTVDSWQAGDFGGVFRRNALKPYPFKPGLRR